MPTLVRRDGLRVEAANVIQHADRISGVAALSKTNINFRVAAQLLARPFFPQTALAKNIHFQWLIGICDWAKRAGVGRKTCLHEVWYAITKCFFTQRKTQKIMRRAHDNSIAATFRPRAH